MCLCFYRFVCCQSKWIKFERVVPRPKTILILKQTYWHHEYSINILHINDLPFATNIFILKLFWNWMAQTATLNVCCQTEESGTKMSYVSILQSITLKCLSELIRKAFISKLFYDRVHLIAHALHTLDNCTLREYDLELKMTERN